MAESAHGSVRRTDQIIRRIIRRIDHRDPTDKFLCPTDTLFVFNESLRTPPPAFIPSVGRKT